MAAGLYDRAEDMFNQLTDETDFRTGAATTATNLLCYQRVAESNSMLLNAREAG